MAYQKVGGTPRFYIDWTEYQKSLGTLEPKEMDFVEGDGSPDFLEGVVTLEEMMGAIGLDPVTPLVLPVNGLNTWGRITLTSGAPANVDYESFPNYVAVLNHNFLDANVKFNVQSSSTGYDTYTISLDENIINYETEGQSFPDWGGKNGFSITTLKNNVNPVASQYIRFLLASGTQVDVGDGTIPQTTFADDIHIGAISFGRFYDMPTSPDLDLTMSIEFDGVNNIKTLNGSTITQANYQGSPWWYDKDGNRVEPWSVGESTGISKRNGRRVWKLKFSYMSDKDLFASNYGSSTYAENLDGYVVGDKDIPNWGQNIVTNGTFTTDSDWTKNTGWTITGGVAVATSAPTQNINQSGLTVTSGKDYKVTFEIKSVSGGNGFYWNIGGVKGTTRNSVNVFEEEITAVSDDSYIRFYSDGSDGTIDNVVVVESNDSDFYYNIDNDDSFSAQVLNKISHGEKFIFQPDNTSNNPSDFAIAVLDGDSFSMKRTAWNVYDIEMTIKEVW